MTFTDCPCGSGYPFPACCAPYLAGMARPETAVALMRSRYSAFVRRNGRYLHQTLAAEKATTFDPDSVNDPATQWLGLEVRDIVAGGKDDNTGTVEFVARYRQNGMDVAHHETSRFEKRDGVWFYVDGDYDVNTAPARATFRIGRNDPCPCGSGLKHKKCCGK
ncbi:MAG: YchJ family metal-binding protein [Pseudomonadota bacterium]